MAELDINSALSKIMANPDALRGIMQAVSGMQISSGEEKSAPAEEKIAEVQHRASPRGDDNSENRRRLLSALKPYLSEGRRDKVERVLSVIQMLELAQASGILSQFGL